VGDEQLREVVWVEVVSFLVTILWSFAALLLPPELKFRPLQLFVVEWFMCFLEGMDLQIVFLG